MSAVKLRSVLKFSFIARREIGNADSYPVDVVGAVHLLVLGVRAVVAGAHGEQHDVLAGRILKGQGDGDAAALTGHVWLHAKH